MEVIGIVQTDLNEFNILYSDPKNKKGNQSQSSQNDFDLFNFFGDDEQSGDQGQQSSDQQNNKGNGNDSNQQSFDQYQEMIVRIKGIPEGQKATFLQMYQIIQDAREEKDLSRQCTVVSRGDDQQQNQQSGGNMRQGKSRPQ